MQSLISVGVDNGGDANTALRLRLLIPASLDADVISSELIYVVINLISRFELGAPCITMRKPPQTSRTRAISRVVS